MRRALANDVKDASEQQSFRDMVKEVRHRATDNQRLLLL